MSKQEKEANKRFAMYVILNYAIHKRIDFDQIREFLESAGIYDLLIKYTSPWISHNQKWREAKIDSILKYKGIDINDHLTTNI
jgi:hypothetical protein